MPIRFIPNDPLVINVLPAREQEPRSDRAENQAGFTFFDQVAEDLYDIGTPESLFWQCREAALAAVETWELLDGELSEWARATPNRRRLKLRQNNGTDLNAFYDGDSLEFFEHTTGLKTTFSGASTDVVAHEVGHAFLDAIRPDLWDSLFIETGALHEGFADCVAILTALFDVDTRRALLAASPDLRSNNFVEATVEDLSDGVLRFLGANHPAAAPRHAFNDFLWQLPGTLPASGPPPVLSREVHSFGRIFSGCFYDTVANIFESLPKQDEDSLLEAARIAGRLLIAGVRAAPEVARFFSAVGRGMVLADQAETDGKHRRAIRTAFERHRVALEGTALLTPTAVLPGRAPQPVKAAAEAAESSRRMTITAATRRDLLERIGAPSDTRLSVSRKEIAGEPVAEAVYRREVPLDDLSEQLQGVVARVSQSVLLGDEGGRAAVLGLLPEPITTRDEVHTFVESLLRNDAIAFDGPTTRRRRGVVAAPSADPTTHTVRTAGDKKVLSRTRFLCDHCCRGRGRVP